MSGDFVEVPGQVAEKNVGNISQQHEDGGGLAAGGELPGIVAEKAVPSGREYRYEQKHYAAQYKQSDRTIKRWIKTGRDAVPADLPPLDDPVAMVAWWPRHYKHKVPVEILDAAKGGEPKAPAASVLDPAPAAAPAPAASLIEVGSGFHEMLQRVRAAEAKAYRDYEAVLHDEARLPAARKVWAEISKQLRELERDSHDILSRSGALVERSVVEKEIAAIHAPIINGIRSMWKRVKDKMLAAEDSKRAAIWQEECDRLLGRLNTSSFAAHE